MNEGDTLKGVAMPYSIWQPIDDRDLFKRGLSDQELADIPRRKVYEGKVPFSNAHALDGLDIMDSFHITLERLFERFNLNHPADFRGHSLSVNDVVVLGEQAFVCKSIGWDTCPAPKGE